MSSDEESIYEEGLSDSSSGFVSDNLDGSEHCSGGTVVPATRTGVSTQRSSSASARRLQHKSPANATGNAKPMRPPSVSNSESPCTGDATPAKPPGTKHGSTLAPTQPNVARQDDVQASASKAENDQATVSRARMREANIKAMLSNTVEVERQAVLPRFLKLRESEKILKMPFQGVRAGQPAQTDDLKRRLSAMRKFVPWGGGGNFVPAHMRAAVPDEPCEEDEDAQEEEKAEAAGPSEQLPEGIEPLFLWRPEEGEVGQPVRVDDMLTKFLRAHQREGLQFLFDCVCGLKSYDGQGCILADDMGLGKTLQGIALMWTLLKNGHEKLGGSPVCKRAMIVCPTSLVNNWDSECKKWLQGRAKTLPLCESSRDDVIHSVKTFLGKARPYDVLIVSYETFRIHAGLFANSAPIDLLICDEAHRLKNDETKTNKALDSLSCRRRVLLSGTPMQNHLDEFFAMVNFCNPGVLGSPSAFRKHYESPILASREPGASPEVLQKGEQRSEELSSIVNDFILRRTNKLLSEFQPPKLVEVVCCKMTQMQRDVYNHFIESKAAARLMNQGKGGTKVLGAITALKKLCNHPKLVYDVIHSKSGGASDGFEGCSKFFPPGTFDDGRPGRGGLSVGWEALSGKFAVVAKMLDILWNRTKDKIVIVSNYTQTLDLITTLCRNNDYPFVRLDGTTTINKRQKMVEAFNDANQRNFVFLLSSKAGGCGLNLIGANRLILFDPDWNPATDKQAAARVWRNGQKKHVYVYRLLATGTLEEKVFQRQLSKEGLSNVVNQSGKSAASHMSAEDLADLFTPEFDSLSSTYDSMVDASEASAAMVAAAAAAGDPPPVIERAQIGAPTEEEVKEWAWHSNIQNVDDEVLRIIGDEHISFAFTLHVSGCPVQEPCGILQNGGGQGQAGKRGAGGVPGRLRQGALPSLLARKAGAGATAASGSRASAPAAVAARPKGKLPGASLSGLLAGGLSQRKSAAATLPSGNAAAQATKSTKPAATQPAAAPPAKRSAPSKPAGAAQKRACAAAERENAAPAALAESNVCSDDDFA